MTNTRYPGQYRPGTNDHTGAAAGGFLLVTRGDTRTSGLTGIRIGGARYFGLAA